MTCSWRFFKINLKEFKMIVMNSMEVRSFAVIFIFIDFTDLFNFPSFIVKFLILFSKCKSLDSQLTIFSFSLSFR